MNLYLSNEIIIRKGTYLYDGSIECDVRIIRSPIHIGSGDYEDPAEIRNDLEQDTFYIQFGSTTERGLFNASSIGYLSIEDAVAAAVATPGIGLTIRWAEDVANEV